MNIEERFEEYDPWINVNDNPTDEQKKAAQELLDKYERARKEKKRND